MTDLSTRRWIETIEPRVFLSAAPLDSPQSQYLCSAAKPSVCVDFGFNVDQSSLCAADLALIDVSTGLAPNVGVPSVCYDPIAKSATWQFPSALPDGNFRATLRAGSVTDTAGNPLTADVTVNFFALGGDANRDRRVDINDLAVLSANWQSADKLFTQGDFNYDGRVDSCDLGILSCNWQKFQPPPAPQSQYLCCAAKPSVSVTFGFDLDQSTLSAADLVVIDVSTGLALNVGASLVSYDPIARSATWQFPGALPDGNFRATLPAGSVTDTAGNPLAADVTLNFFALGGDANRDRIVDINDLAVLSANWQGCDKLFNQGDFNYDGKVDACDLGILSCNWQKTQPPQAPPVQPVVVARRSPVRALLA